MICKDFNIFAQENVYLCEKNFFVKKIKKNKMNLFFLITYEYFVGSESGCFEKSDPVKKNRPGSATPVFRCPVY